MDASSPPRLSPTKQKRSSASVSLDRSLVQGIAWTSAAKWSGQVLSWASTLIVARLLSPEDYGLVGMASIYLALITMLSEFGLGTTVTAMQDLTETELAQLGGFAIIFGIASFLLSCAVAIPLGIFFHSPEMPAVVIVMSFAFIITAFRILPAALLQRELQFRNLAFIDAARSIVLAFVMIAFAWFGFRYWTLVIGGIVSSLIATVQTVMLRRHRIAWPRVAALRHAMRYSWHVLASRLSWYAYSNADFLVAGRLLGKAALGVYDFAWTLANVPVDKVTALVGQVTFPIFAAVKDDRAELSRYLLRITEGVALLTFPAAAGMTLVANDFVLAFLGTKWEGAIIPLRLLSVFVGFRSITPLLPPVLLVLGESSFAMWNSIISAVVMPTAFYLMGTRWGTTGLALAWVIVYPFLAAMLYWRVFTRLRLPLYQYLRALWPAASSTIVLCAVVFGVKGATPAGLSHGAAFGIQAAAGAAAFGLAVLLLHRARLVEFVQIVRSK